jgi:putative ABC transport system permease protein
VAGDISYTGLLFVFLLLIIPLVIMKITKLNMARESLTAIFRMTIQLFLAGFFLTVIFDMNNSVLNFLWLLMMISFAAFESIQRQRMNLKSLYLLTLASFLFGNLLILLYLNFLVIDISNVFEARYLIPIGGILLGSSLRGNIVGVSNFYNGLKRNQNRYVSSLSFGAKKHEALLPYLRNGLQTALKPAVGDISTIGIVHLPGMMTGQMIAGSSPLLAIKYQIAVMIGVYVSTVICVTLSILLTSHVCFDDYGLLREEMFREGSIG